VSLIDINGKKLHILTIKGNQADLPIALFLHGLLIGSSAGWYVHIASKLQKFCHVILLDFPGHGLSEKTKTGYDSESLMMDVQGVMDFAKATFMTQDNQKSITPSFYLIGHSYGAWVALKSAMRWPRSIKGIVLVELPLPPTLSDLPIQATSAESLLASLPLEVQDTLVKGKRQGIKRFEALSFLLIESSLLKDLAQERDLDDQALSQLPFHKLVIYAKSSACIVALPRLQRLFTQTPLASGSENRFEKGFEHGFEVVEGGHFILNENASIIETLIHAFIQKIESNHG
jgi:pimeloyl-ACP methyl ester carboxylesterase